MKTIQTNRKACKQALNRFKRYSYKNENVIHYTRRPYDNFLCDNDNNQTTIQNQEVESCKK
jgi:hypothetical protein